MPAWPMAGEWHSYSPDGREVVVRRQGGLWRVRCGQSQTEDKNLDLALMEAVRRGADVMAQAKEFDYPTWIRTAADSIESSS